MITSDLEVIDMDGAFQDLVLDFFNDNILAAEKALKQLVNLIYIDLL